MPLINLKAAESFVEGLDHPEGIAFGLNGKVYAGGEAGQVYRIDYETRNVEEYANTGGLNLGMALDAAGNVYICTPGRKAVLKVMPTGEVSVYSRGIAERPMITPNYPAFGADGCLYVTDSGNWHADNGCIYAIAPDGATSIIDTENCQFPNGCALSPDGRHLYIVMSVNMPRVVRFSVAAGRKTGRTETVVELPHTVPDGLAFCSNGDFLVSCYRPDSIFHVSAAGDVNILMDDYEGTLLGAPTNVCFCGADLSVLLWGNLGRWHIGRHTRTGLNGSPLFCPDFR